MATTTIYVTLSIIIALVVPSIASKLSNQKISSFLDKKHSDIVKI